jgi:glycosyltransferase involved in cell wall biosynthesis
MRILLIIDWNRGRGGAEAYAATLRDGLRAAGEEVRLLTSSAGTAGDGTADYVAYGTERRAAQTLLQIANPFAVQTVREALRDFRPDVVWINMFAHHLSPAVILALGEVPAVLLVSDYKLICPLGSKLLPDGSICRSRAGWVCRRSGCVGLLHWLRDQPRYSAIRAATRKVRRVLACSSWMQSELANEGIEAEILVMPAPAPPPAFARRPAKEPRFLYFGRLDIEKGVDLLIRAFSKLLVEHPTAELQIVGQGPERGNLQSLSTRLRARRAVEFLSWMSPAELDRPLAEAWAAVVPSTWAEPLGLAAVEAVIRGTPAIVTSAGGLTEIVEHGVNGLIFPNQDEAALLDCLRQVASRSLFPNQRLSDDVVRRSRERFSVEHNVDRIRQVFREVVEEATGKALR